MTISLTEILLREISAERSDAIVVELGMGAAIEVPKSVDIIAHFVLEGHITVDVDQMEEPQTISRGEYALLLYGNRHHIVADDASHHEDHVIREWPVGEEPATLALGEGKPAAKFISAALRSVYNPVSIQAQHPLAELLHLRRGLLPLFRDAVLLTDMVQIGAACRGPGASAFVNSLMNMHMFHAFRCAYDKMKNALPLVSPMEILRSPSIRPVAVAVRLLRLHPERHWTVADLARELGQSRSALAANFSTCVGIGPMEYLNKVRMEKAAELLQSRRDLSLCAIGRQVGYDNTSSFARAFKAHYGVPPRAFPARACVRAA